MAKKPKPMTEEAFIALVDRCVDELRVKTQAHVDAWGLGTLDQWNSDQTTGLIVFTGPKATATAPFQVIGTYSTTTGTFLWGWDHPSVLEPMADHARRVRAFGEEHGVALLTTRKLECDEQLAWGFAALACHLCGAQGVYRGPAGAAFVFMTFGEVTLTKSKAKRRKA